MFILGSFENNNLVGAIMQGYKIPYNEIGE